MTRIFTDGREGSVLALAPQAVGVGYDQPRRDQSPAPPPSIAILPIMGPISQRADGWFDGFDAIAERFAAALASDAGAVILKIDSPGGDAAGCNECVRSMLHMKDDAGKPVIAYADEAAYSAAYAIACAADEIYLPQSGGVGSIGCLTVAADMTRAVADAGINAVVVRSGALKADGHPLLPLDNATIARFQGRVDELAALFADLVAERRGLSRKRILGLQGGVVYGARAVDVGLADGIISFRELVSGLAARLDEVAQSFEEV